MKSFSPSKKKHFFKSSSSIFRKSYIAFGLLFLYLPLFIMMIFAFNNQGNIFSFKGFKFGFYYFGLVFTDSTFAYSILTTIMIGIFSTIISTVIGTLAAISLSHIRSKIGKVALFINDIPIINADIATAFALLILFLSLGLPFGFFSMLMAHVSFCLPYVVITILARIMFINESIIEASLDLGASPLTTLKKIVIPIIMPSIFIGAALSFAMSFDDFIVSYFTGGSVQNISVYLYALKHFTPIVSAFSVLLLIVIAIIFITSAIFKEKEQKKIFLEKKLIKINNQILQHSNSANLLFGSSISKVSIKLPNTSKILLALENKKKIVEQKLEIEKSTDLRKEMRNINVSSNIKKIIFAIIGVLSITTITGYYIYLNLNSITIAIYGSYIDSKTINDFQHKYHKHVNVINYSSSEQLFVKRKTTNFAFTMPSDYMVDKMAQTSYLSPIDYKLLETKMNFSDPSKTGDNFKNLLLPKINDITSKYKITDAHKNKVSLQDYFLPYYWGSLVWISKNPSPEDLNPTWATLWQRMVIEHKKILFSDDARNTLTVSTQLLLYQAQQIRDGATGLPGFNDAINAIGGNEVFNQVTDPNNYETAPETGWENRKSGLNMNSQNVIEACKKLWIWMLGQDQKQVSFEGDDIQANLASGRFDYALCYNSDASYAYNSLPTASNPMDNYGTGYMHDETGNTPGSIIKTNSQFANDIWIDGFSVSSNLSSKVKDLTYDFLAFIYEEQRAEHIAKWSGASSAITNVNEAQKNDAKNKPFLFSCIEGPVWSQDTTKFMSGYELYTIRFEKEIADFYNQILVHV